MNAATIPSTSLGDMAGPLIGNDPQHDGAATSDAPDSGIQDGLADGLDAGPTALRAGPALPAGEEQLIAWMDAIVDRDERALAALYDATFARTFGLVRRILRRDALAEEVVEETYFQVWRQAIRFNPQRGHALTWLLSIARSRAIDALRREARFQHESMDDAAVADGPASDEPPQDELLDLVQHQADLHQALTLLGAQPRQLVALAFFRGLSHEEIAQQTRLPLGTVKSQIRRALQTLRQILGEMRPAPGAT